MSKLTFLHTEQLQSLTYTYTYTQHTSASTHMEKCYIFPKKYSESTNMKTIVNIT